MRTCDLDEVLQDEVRVVGPTLPVVITPVLIDALAVDPDVARLSRVEVLVALVHREEVLQRDVLADHHAEPYGSMAVTAEDVFEAHGLIRHLPRDEVILDVCVGEHRGDVGVFARDVPRALVVLPVEDGEEVGLLRSDLLGLEVLTLDALEGLFGTDIAPEEHPDELHPLSTPEETLLLPVIEEDDLDT